MEDFILLLLLLLLLFFWNENQFSAATKNGVRCLIWWSTASFLGLWNDDDVVSRFQKKKGSWPRAVSSFPRLENQTDRHWLVSQLGRLGTTGIGRQRMRPSCRTLFISRFFPWDAARSQWFLQVHLIGVQLVGRSRLFLIGGATRSVQLEGRSRLFLIGRANSERPTRRTLAPLFGWVGCCYLFFNATELMVNFRNASRNWGGGGKHDRSGFLCGGLRSPKETKKKKPKKENRVIFLLASSNSETVDLPLLDAPRSWFHWFPLFGRLRTDFLPSFTEFYRVFLQRAPSFSSSAPFLPRGADRYNEKDDLILLSLIVALISLSSWLDLRGLDLDVPSFTGFFMDHFVVTRFLLGFYRC